MSSPLTPPPFENSPIAVTRFEFFSASDSPATFNSMDVGDTFLGSLSVTEDSDWIELELTAGQTVKIDMDSRGTTSPLLDPRFVIADDASNVVSIGDDRDFEGGDYNSTIYFTAYEDQTIYIVASGYAQAGNGDYTVSVSLAPNPPAFDPVQSLTWGTQLADTSVNVFLANAGFTADGVTAEGFNAYERQQIELAFQMIENVSGLTFNFVTTSATADLKIIGDANEIGVGQNALLGYFYPQGEGPNAGLGVFATNLWDRSAGGDLELGGNGHATIVHEILHGLGLSHPHDNGGGSTIVPWVTEAFGNLGAYGLNQGVYTTMSYNVGLTHGPTGGLAEGAGNILATPELDWGVQAGPMALDIAVLQALYGANTTFAAGNNIYTIPSANMGGTSWQAIWDTGGIDELRYQFGRDAIIDLRAATLEDDFGGGGFVSGADGIAGGFTIAHGVVIENATSGAGDDQVFGNDADNILTTGFGDDIVYSGLGHDTLDLGGDNDQAWGGSGNDTMFGGAGNDFLRGSVDQDVLYGGDGNDQLRGQKHNDTLYGEIGNDNLVAGGGNDILFGGAGSDYLSGGTRRDVMEGGDGDDRIFGNAFDDTLFGGSGNDLLNGGGENDTLVGGVGNDSLRGGEGEDIFVFTINDGNDVIDDFSALNDRIQISAALANGLSVADIVDLSIVSQNTLMLEFDLGVTILMSNFTDTAGLLNAIDIV